MFALSGRRVSPLGFFALVPLTWQSLHAISVTAAPGSEGCHTDASNLIAGIPGTDNGEGAELLEVSLLQFNVKLTRKQYAGIQRSEKRTSVPQYVCVTYVGVLLLILLVTQSVWEKRGFMLWHTVDLPTAAQGSKWFESCKALACYRLACAVFVFCIDILFISHPGKHESKEDAKFNSSASFASFTLWCWNLIGLYFLIAASASMLQASACVRDDLGVVRLLCCLTWVLFQVAYTCALFVFFMVWLVLVPQLYVHTGSVHALVTPFPLIFHNANILMLAVEGMSNRFRMCRTHVLFVLYFAAAYVIFSWVWFERHGLFFYDFIDYRSPLTPVWYTALIILLCLCFIALQSIVAVATDK
eukprot:TRINITY_DN45360_c0_g1_i1.p1 TRINITY_DN45360_c0_g1~~TRINITY_DN45360_c0_g1_i1.p1  ORF type:complete len:358 (+),score=29.98 TRINITY_DN45360_c0_g1_i1:158-1231(+)